MQSSVNGGCWEEAMMLDMVCCMLHGGLQREGGGRDVGGGVG